MRPERHSHAYHGGAWSRPSWLPMDPFTINGIPMQYQEPIPGPSCAPCNDAGASDRLVVRHRHRVILAERLNMMARSTGRSSTARRRQAMLHHPKCDRRRQPVHGFLLQQEECRAIRIQFVADFWNVEKFSRRRRCALRPAGSGEPPPSGRRGSRQMIFTRSTWSAPPQPRPLNRT